MDDGAESHDDPYGSEEEEEMIHPTRNGMQPIA